MATCLWVTTMIPKTEMTNSQLPFNQLSRWERERERVDIFTQVWMFWLSMMQVAFDLLCPRVNHKWTRGYIWSKEKSPSFQPDCPLSFFLYDPISPLFTLKLCNADCNVNCLRTNWLSIYSSISSSTFPSSSSSSSSSPLLTELFNVGDFHLFLS